jgi:poly-gamma-glutamate capsule biosynthesis protein CapA/YwtB (metallophosphatase superfamily)
MSTIMPFVYKHSLRMLVAFFFVSPMVLNGQDTTRISLFFAGDIMGHDSQIAAAYDPAKKTYDYSWAFKHVKPYASAADLAFANLEVTLAGKPYKGYPQFSSPDALAVAVKEAGFDILVTANNHCVDRGRKGLERTVRILDSLEIPHTGTFRDSVDRIKNNPLMIYKNGFAIALLNYTYGTNGLPVYKPNIVNLIDTVLIRKDIEKAKELKPDILIVFTHWGSEYESLPRKTQKDVAEFCFRKGAQLVVGAHPHVIQPMEWRQESNQFVAYSLGNFISGQRNRYTDGGAMALVHLQKVIFAVDSSTTSIDSAGYYLEYNYRTPVGKKYTILPAADGDAKNRKLVADSASRAAYDLFLKDSRALYKKHNINVTEIKGPPVPEIKRFRILLLKTRPNEDPWKILTSQQLYVHGVDRFPNGDGTISWTTGAFGTEEDAMRYLERYRHQHPEATIIPVQE